MASTPITGQTRLAGVIGSPVRHSASPAMHNAAFGALGLDWVYVALEVAGDSGENAVQAMRTLGLGGLNVTMPHKDAVARTADRLTPVAEALQSVNTLYWDGSQIVGHSTDGDGFVKAFAAQSQTPLSNAKVAVLGTGGAARSIVEAIGRSGAARIVVAGRDISKAETAARLATKGHACSLSDYDSVGECDIIINATSVGMAGGSDPEGIPFQSGLSNRITQCLTLCTTRALPRSWPRRRTEAPALLVGSECSHIRPRNLLAYGRA